MHQRLLLLLLLAACGCKAGSGDEPARPPAPAGKAAPRPAPDRTREGLPIDPVPRGEEPEPALPAPSTLGAAERISLGGWLVGAERYAEAQGYLESALREQPTDRTTRYLLAAALLETGEWARARDLARGLLAERPSEPKYRFIVRLSELVLGETGRAIARWLPASALDPSQLHRLRAAWLERWNAEPSKQSGMAHRLRIEAYRCDLALALHAAGPPGRPRQVRRVPEWIARVRELTELLVRAKYGPEERRSHAAEHQALQDQLADFTRAHEALERGGENR